MKSGLAKRTKWRHFQGWTLGNNTSVYRPHKTGAYIIFLNNSDTELEVTVCKVSSNAVGPYIFLCFESQNSFVFLLVQKGTLSFKELKDSLFPYCQNLHVDSDGSSRLRAQLLHKMHFKYKQNAVASIAIIESVTHLI